MSVNDTPTDDEPSADELAVPETHEARRESDGRMRVFDASGDGDESARIPSAADHTEAYVEGPWVDPTNLKL